jgi:hypothetical protein
MDMVSEQLKLSVPDEGENLATDARDRLLTG